jgi:hypothetical protein
MRGNSTIAVRLRQTVCVATCLGLAALAAGQTPVATAYILVSPSTWVEEGNRVQLMASIPGAISYTWYKDGELLPDEPASFIIFDPITLADAGHYFCRIDDGDIALIDTSPVTVVVFSAGALPLSSAAALALLAAALAAGGFALICGRRGTA